MSENVIPMFGHIMHDEPPEKILEHAAKWNMTKCLVLGVTETDEFIFGGSTSDLKDMLWIVSRALWYIQNAENMMLGTAP